MSTINSNIPELSEEQITILDNELIAYEKNPEEGSTLEDVKRRILSTY